MVEDTVENDDSFLELGVEESIDNMSECCPEDEVRESAVGRVNLEGTSCTKRFPTASS